LPEPRPRRVLIVATWYPTDRDPIGGVFVEDQARVLATRYDVAVIAPDLRRLVAAPRRGLPRPLVVERRNGILVLRPGAIAVKTWRQAGWSYRRAIRRAFEELEATWGRPDVIHAHVVFPGGWSAAHLGLRLGIPVVLTEHSSPFSSRLSTPWLRQQVAWTLRQVDRCIAVSPGMRAQIRDFAAVDVDVIGNVCDTAFFRPPDAATVRGSRPFRFLTVGILTPQKGVDILLAACSRLLQRGREGWELAIGGDGPSRRSLEEEAASLGLRDRCRFVGALSRAATRDWMGWADVFVLASRHETFGMVVLEALACDRPVVATRSGGPESILTEEVGTLVEPNDPEALADALEGILDGKLRPPAGAARALAVERYGPEAFVRSIDALYASLG
jgi:glycosyltransferase involved in cell wall biosynthesis